MGWRWDWFWNVVYNLVVHAVLLQWSKLPGDKDALVAWFNSFWSAIQDAANAVRSWAQGQLSSLSGYAYGLYLRAVDWVNGQVSSVRSWAQGQLSTLQGYAYALYVQAINWVGSQVNTVRSWTQGLVDRVYAWSQTYLQAAVGAVRSLFEWINFYRELIAGWLVNARAVVDWLWQQAWGRLQAFLADPVGFVLGRLLTPLLNGVNWWVTNGQTLIEFVRDDVPRLRNLLARGFALLMRFIDRPGETILDLVLPSFLDWLEKLLAENW